MSFADLTPFWQTCSIMGLIFMFCLFCCILFIFLAASEARNTPTIDDPEENHDKPINWIDDELITSEQIEHIQNQMSDNNIND